MPASFHIAPRFHPAYSVLGLLLRWRGRDPRRAEARLILVLTGLALALLLLQYLGWALWKDPILADPDGPTALVFWFAQLTAAAGLFFLGLFGVAPAITLTLTPDALVIVQGRQQHTVRRADLRGAESITALRYHRHERRYAATRSFVGHLPETLLLLRTPDGPIVLGLKAADQATLLEALLPSATTTSTAAPGALVLV